MRALILTVVIAAGAAGCSDKPGTPPPPADGGRARRVFTKPPGTVRAVPPHAIRAEGVGPYALGARLKDVLGLLPRGPRVALIEIDDVIQYSLVQAEDDKLVIGAERTGGVSFVTVLDHDIARTELGAGVRTTRAELEETLGAPISRPNRAADPRIGRFAALPNVRFVLDGERVMAVSVTEEDRPLPRPTPAPDAPPLPPPPIVETLKRCTLDALRAVEDQVVDTAGIGSPTRVSYGCLDGSTPMAVVFAGERLSVVVGDAGKTRRLRIETLADLAFAAPIDVDGDGADELATVFARNSPNERIARIEVHRIESGKLQRVAGTDVYRISGKSARWAGAKLSQIELLLELKASENTVVVGGLYVQHDDRSARIVAPLIEQRVSVRGRGQTEPAASPPPVDAGAPPDAAVRPRKPPRHDAGRRPKPRSQDAAE
ncbi:MAG TPA: hypothetical protein VML75_10855 [Kofleriaceae bacterium]|nr:hypothetical protein [Kofleriaceae bacterium]